MATTESNEYIFFICTSFVVSSKQISISELNKPPIITEFKKKNNFIQQKERMLPLSIFIGDIFIDAPRLGPSEISAES